MGAPSPELVDLWLARAFNAQDIEAAAAMYHPGARPVRLEQVHGSTAVAQGAEEIRELMAGYVGLKPHMDVVVHHTTIAGDFALCRSQWRITGTDRNGNAVEVHHHGMEVMRRPENGEWVFFIDHPWGPMRPGQSTDRRTPNEEEIMSEQMVTTRFPTEADFAASKIKQLSDLINEVYDDAESGMWKRTGTRTNPSEVERLLSNQALILAEIDGMLVGAVNVNLMNDGIGEFGMLVADLNHRGKGIGSALVDRAENWARDMGCHTMRLELLTPRNWTHPSKEFLKKWYSRIGYKPQATESFEILHPELVPELATECDFTVWHKSLT